MVLHIGCILALYAASQRVETYLAGPGTQLSRGCGGPDCAGAYWAPGAWGACNATCGGGAATRSLACMQGNATAAASACAALPRPPASRACNSVPCVGYAWQARNGPAMLIGMSVSTIEGLGWHDGHATDAASACMALPRPPCGSFCNSVPCNLLAWQPRKGPALPAATRTHARPH